MQARVCVHVCELKNKACDTSTPRVSEYTAVYSLTGGIEVDSNF